MVYSLEYEEYIINGPYSRENSNKGEIMKNKIDWNYILCLALVAVVVILLFSLCIYGIAERNNRLKEYYKENAEEEANKIEEYREVSEYAKMILKEDFKDEKIIKVGFDYVSLPTYLENTEFYIITLKLTYIDKIDYISYLFSVSNNGLYYDYDWRVLDLSI